VVVRHGGRRARCLYPCISAMETRVFRIGGECGRKLARASGRHRQGIRSARPAIRLTLKRDQEPTLDAIPRAPSQRWRL
jgi:hypothetical protein